MRLVSDAATMWPARASLVRKMVNECHARLTKKDFFDVRFNSLPPTPPNKALFYPAPCHECALPSGLSDHEMTTGACHASSRALRLIRSQGLPPLPFPGLWTALKD